MLLAKSESGERIEATRGATGTCPICGDDLIAKCGEIIRPHWSHHARPDCDEWHSEETAWHLDWKAEFPIESREIVMERRGEKHRADVRIGDLVIEFQNSPIRPEDVRRRESFYRRMCWVFNATEAFSDGRLVLLLRPEMMKMLSSMWRPGLFRVRFRWTSPRRTPVRCSRPVFLDLGKGLVFDVRQLSGETRAVGWGYLRTRGEFIEGMALREPRGHMEMLSREPHRWLASEDITLNEERLWRAWATWHDQPAGH